MKTIKLFVILFLLFSVSNAQEKLPVIKSNVNVISIEDGSEMKKNSWTLAPDAKPDIYETSVKQGQKKKVTFITDADKISFEVEAGKTYDFIIQKGDAMCYTQIKAHLLNFWNDKDFWESPTMKTSYKENISDEEKLFGLSKFWSEVKYNFINFHLVPDLDWDQKYFEFIPKVLATKSTLKYYKVLEMLCANLKDGHTNIYMPREVSSEIYAKPAITPRLIENKVILIAIFDEKLKQEGLKLGQEILKIDGIPVKEYAEKNILPFTSASTQQEYDFNLYQISLLAGAVSKSIEITFKDLNGKEFTKVLPRLSNEERNKLIAQTSKNQGNAFEFRMLEGNVALVKVNTMVDERKADQMFAEKFSEIAKADSMILDLRDNGGGSTGIGYRILSFLVDKPFKGSKWFTREYHPSFRPWGRPEKTYGSEDAYEVKLDEIKRMRGDAEPFLKPVVVLTSPRTGSAAEDFLVAFKPLNRGLIIGEPSTGSTGQPLVISLPGGGAARICSKHDTFADGTAFVGIGVIPNILVSPKITDFTKGKDTVLEAALLELRKK